jgi:hypothetical protein
MPLLATANANATATAWQIWPDLQDRKKRSIEIWSKKDMAVAGGWAMQQEVIDVVAREVHPFLHKR